VKLLSIPKAIDITLIAESFLLGNQVAEHPAEQVVGVAEKGCVYHSDIERDLARIRVTERAASFAVKAKEVEVIDIGVGSNPNEENAFNSGINVAGNSFLPGFNETSGSRGTGGQDVVRYVASREYLRGQRTQRFQLPQGTLQEAGA